MLYQFYSTLTTRKSGKNRKMGRELGMEIETKGEGGGEGENGEMGGI